MRFITTTQMARSAPILAFLCLLSFLLHSQPHTKRFENGVYYLEYLPPGYDPNGTETYPLMIFLHGAGERSDTPAVAMTHAKYMANLDRVKKNGPPHEIEEGHNMCFTVSGQPERCFIVLSPQRDESGFSWVNTTQELIEFAQSNYKVELNRIYITGLSMGGIGTLDYIQGSSSRPWATQFAAAAVAPGGGGSTGAACIMEQRNIEFWAVHGRTDGTGGTKYTDMVTFINAVQACTPKPLTTLYAVPGVGHNVWLDFYHTGADASYTPDPDKRYSPNVYEWFLMNPKNNSNTSPNQAPVVNAGADATITGTTFSRQGTASDHDWKVTALTMNWTQISGPAATISQSAITTTTTLARRTINVSNMNVDGVYRFKLTSTDTLNRTGEDIVEVTRGTAPVCTATGTITREQWDGVAGTDVSAIPVGSTPSSTSTLTIFEGPTNIGTDYGARIRGYICPPATGNYTFWIASDDKSELWISTDDSPGNKVLRASVPDHTAVREWTRYSQQTSVPVSLVAGQKYYIEALHKEASGGDHVAVGWQLPDGTLERPIAGSRLSPFTAITTCTASGEISREQWDGITGTDVSLIPTGTTPSSTGTLTIFEGPTNIGSDYGARIRGYICAPQTGNYTFWIASDDKSQLWVSTTDNPADKALRASVPDHTAVREWTRYTSQTSVPVSLVAGQRYYIEALHKEATGGDHIAVGWQLPDGTLERPIPGTRLSPFGSGGARIAAHETAAVPQEESEVARRFGLHPNPVKDVLQLEGVGDATDIRIYNVQGIPLIHANGGSISVNTSGLSPGIYFLVLKDGAKVERHKFVKE